VAVSGAKAWRRVEIVFGDRELSSVLYAVSEEAPARVQDVDALLSAFVGGCLNGLLTMFGNRI